MDALSKAIAECGSEAELARRMGGSVRGGHIYYWKKKGRVPADHCRAIEEATAGVVTKESLRPDIWPPHPSAGQPQRADSEKAA